MKCEVCGGVLVWDYEYGEIVCSQCGVVHGRIFSSDIPGYHTSEKHSRGDQVEKSSANTLKPSLFKYRRLLRLYLTANRKIRGKPWLEVNYNKLFETGRFVKTITSVASMKARESIEKHEYWEIINRGLKVLETVNPALLARSERCKYALAYMIAKTIETGEIPSEEEVTSIFNVSETSYRRLKLIITSIQSRPVLAQFKST